jgi:NAD(P)H-flavin reductase
LQYLTGWSYEGLNIFHRRLGEWMVAYGFLHGVAMFGVWYTLLRPFHFTLVHYLTARVVLLGIFSLVAYIAIWITSIGWIRYLYYEAFLGMHVVLQVAALVLLFFHHLNSRPYVIAALAIWAADRIASRVFLSKRKLVASLQIAGDQKTVLVFCDVPLRPSKSRTGTNISHGWQPGQHVFVIVPGLGGWHSLQSHPFTIASPAPPADMKTGSWPLQLTIRAQNGFSKDLLDFARHHQHTEVGLDGPYGSDEALQAFRSADRTAMIAGGSGIAVTYPLSWDRHVEASDAVVSARIVYEHGIKRGPQDLDYAQVENLEHTHIWVRQDEHADSWIGYVPKDVNFDDSQSRRGVLDLINAKFETAGVHSRRPDVRTELRSWVMQGTRSRQKLVVVVSGPDSLVRDVRNAVATLIREGYKIEIHVEKFGW